MSDKLERQTERTDGPVRLTVQNVGGITDAEFAISDGVTLLSGRNASNKSSLLRALAGVLGGPVPPLKNDAESGSVRLTVEHTEYELHLERRNGTTVATKADVYTPSDVLCELFMALTETNPIRQAILAGDDLYDLLMRPVDTAAISAEISRLSDRKDELDDRLEELDAMESRLPGLRSRRETLTDRQSELEAELRSKRNEVEELEAESDDVSDELQDKRTARNEVRSHIRAQEDAIESLASELDDIRTDLSEQEPVEDETSVADVTAELDRLHEQKQELTSSINALSAIVDMNGRLLDGEGDIPDSMTTDDIAATLNPESRDVDCWTCGSTVERSQITDQVEVIEGLIADRRTERAELTDRIRSLTTRLEKIESHTERRERLQERREEIAGELDRRRDKLDALQSDLRELESDLEELQRATTDNSTHEQRLQAFYDDISDLEYERGRVATDLESVDAEITEIESEIATRDDVATERKAVAAELREQRQRIDTIEQDLVNTCNEMMQEVLEALDYDAIERIWLERRSDRNGADSDSAFELHIVRADDEGTVYDDTVDSLSKSEREVIGLVVALAGYLVHDVGEAVPFLVVDAVEMFDAGRIDGLMELFDEHAEYVVAAVLPEEAYELAETYDTVPTQSFAGT